jgi:hypothetical protein
MTRTTYKGREHDGEQNDMAKAYFLPLGDATCTAQNVWCLTCANNFFNQEK